MLATVFLLLKWKTFNKDYNIDDAEYFFKYYFREKGYENRLDIIKCIIEFIKINIVHVSVSEVSYNIETRNKIHVTLYNEKYLKDLWHDDHDDIYILDNDDFNKEFKRYHYIEDDYNNSFNPINFTTEEECIKFLNSIGLSQL